MNFPKIFLMALLTISMNASAQTNVNSALTADNCLDGQDLDAADVDISKCPVLPNYPQDVSFAGTEETIDLGAWELGQSADGATYVYGGLSDANGTEPRILSHGQGESVVNDVNLVCWAKGYYRLRKIMQNPPADYVKLKDAGFQGRFFQFQTDLRNGRTGFKEIASYMDHLVKWVTRVELDGTCTQPTNAKFQKYLTNELKKRGLEN